MEQRMGFCDLGCRFASWPEQDGMDGSGSCRTFVALHCSLKGRAVHKNMPCRERQEKTAGDIAPRPGEEPGSDVSDDAGRRGHGGS